MKRRTKTLTAAALALMLTFSGNATAKADSTISGRLEGYEITAYCKISSMGAEAATYFIVPLSLKPRCSVSARYVYIDMETLEVGTQNKSAVGTTGCEVNFSAPSGCVSVKIEADHSAGLGTQSWSGSTTKVR